MARHIIPSREVIDEVIKMFKTACYDIAESECKLRIPKVQAKCKIKVYPEVMQKINALVMTCKKEIAWHCLMRRKENSETEFEIYDIMLFPQAITSVTVTSDETEYMNYVMDLDDNTFNNMRCHMHSHVNMGVNPSHVDEEYQNAIVENEENFYFFAIINKKGNAWYKLVDVKNNMLYETADIEFEATGTDAVSWAADQIEKYVKENPPATKLSPKYKSEIEEYMSIARDNLEMEDGWLDDLY